MIHTRGVEDDSIPGYATARDLARIYNVAVGTIYRWAHDDDWDRTAKGWPRRYDRNQAQASYDRRHPAYDTARPVVANP